MDEVRALPGRSFFLLELSYDFEGGASAGELYTYREFRHIESCIAQVLAPTDARERAGLLSAFSTHDEGGSAEARLFLVVAGVAVQCVELGSHLHIRLDDGRMLPLRADRDDSESHRLSKDSVISLESRCLFGFPRALSPPLLAPGQTASVMFPDSVRQGSTLLREQPVRYGFSNAEHLDAIQGTDFVDPDPEPDDDG